MYSPALMYEKSFPISYNLYFQDRWLQNDDTLIFLLGYNVVYSSTKQVFLHSELPSSAVFMFVQQNTLQ